MEYNLLFVCLLLILSIQRENMVRTHTWPIICTTFCFICNSIYSEAIVLHVCACVRERPCCIQIQTFLFYSEIKYNFRVWFCTNTNDCCHTIDVMACLSITDFKPVHTFSRKTVLHSDQILKCNLKKT